MTSNAPINGTNGDLAAELPATSPVDAAMPSLMGPALIRDLVGRLPDRAGVYRMHNVSGEVLYVGKARSLKKRVTAYTKLMGHTQRIARMISEVAHMEIITTASETEALLLEANLIKQLKPRYNVSLRDDKSYPYILVRGDHRFAQMIKYRGAQNKPGEYFGPFASAGAVTRTLNTLQRAFLLRTCSDSVFESRTRPCLLYQIKRCSGPCVGLISEDNYKALAAEAHDFLTGRSAEVRGRLTREMEEASTALDFERAARLRDRIRALASIEAHQDINSSAVGDADVIAAHLEGGISCVQVFFFRNGQNWGNRAYFPRHDKSYEIEDILEAFLVQFYTDKPVPPCVLVSHDVRGRKLIEEALSIRAGRRVSVVTPKRGDKRALMEHARANAREALARRLAESQSQRQLLEAVGDQFGLDAPPNRIEVYDNSHIQGSNAVGAFIVAGPDGFEKSQYRKFNIKSATLTPGDDFAMMREVLTRRFSRLVSAESGEGAAESSGASPRPDLVLIDGGQGQLTAALSVMAGLGLEDIPLVGIAKGPDRNAGRERFFTPGKTDLMLEPRSPVLYYLQRLRDEAHRFAIGSHRARRAKDARSNPLDAIPGVGAARKRALLHHFGSARGVERASLPDLEAVPGVSKAMAKKIHDHFRGP